MTTSGSSEFRFVRPEDRLLASYSVEVLASSRRLPFAPEDDTVPVSRTDTAGPGLRRDYGTLTGWGRSITSSIASAAAAAKAANHGIRDLAAKRSLTAMRTRARESGTGRILAHVPQHATDIVFRHIFLPLTIDRNFPIAFAT